MSSILAKAVIFAVGAAVGSAVTWKLLKTKYERLAQEEIDSVKEVFQSKSKTEDIKTDDTVATDEYKEILVETDYIEKSEVKEMKRPYVIEPNDFGENDYETISLTYYADGVLTDDMDEIIDNVDMIVGEDSLTHFGEYEDDSVFVRNDELKCDYEILLDERKYYDR